MSIKVSLSKKIENVKCFPKLMISNNFIVLFTELRNGTVVNDTDFIGVGYCSKSWNMSDFKDYDGEVILSNK
tara:strand:+ start:51 stop:266 length:216 start_codon:yes stop_codon:yes gene_type:complete